MLANRAGTIATTAIATFLILVFVCATEARSDSSQGENQSGFPTPPLQHAPWTPPASQLPEGLVSAAETLFRYGLADPRGCEYREIEIQADRYRLNGPAVMNSHGWVLPNATPGAEQYAVGWSGLVYRLVSVGERADLRGDVEAALRADDEKRVLHRQKTPVHLWYFEIRRRRRESMSDFTTIFPMKAMLLLRLGEADLAERMWTTYIADLPKDRQAMMRDQADPFVAATLNWMRARLDRAIVAHGRIDDELAMFDATELAQLRSVVEPELKRRTIHPDPRVAAYEPHMLKLLSFLDPLSELFHDQQRRAADRKGQRKDVPVAAASPAGQAAELIERMQDIRVAQPFDRPERFFSGVQTVKALVQLGDAAVDPLIDCLERDERLTRSVWSEGYMHDKYRILRVREVAFEALSSILKASFVEIPYNTDTFSSLERYGYAKAAAKARAYWENRRDLSLTERWYQTLLDDSSSDTQWWEAVRTIIQPDDAGGRPSTVFPRTATFSVRQAAPENRPLRGEALRDGRSPSVSELLERRITRDLRSSPDGRYDGQLRKVVGSLRWFRVWDAAAAQATAQAALVECLEWDAKIDPDRRRPGTANEFGELISEAMRTNDPAALECYARWIRARPLKDLNSVQAKCFSPLWLHREQPAMVELASLFHEPDSIWNPLHTKTFGFLILGQLIESPVVGLAPFQQQLLEQLENRDRAGTIQVRNGGLEMRPTAGSGLNSGLGEGAFDPLLPTHDRPLEFRVCDLYASSLGKLRGAPRCELYWPVEKRDEAVLAAVAFLRQYGHRLQSPPEVSARYGVDGGPANHELWFPPLDHPATHEDVRSGRAIFSLEGAGERRVCKMSELPLGAKWLTLEEYPIHMNRTDNTGSRVTEKGFDQACIVWQAEEVLVDGQWKRYYGVVAKHRLARVPEDELRLWTRPK